MSKAGLEIYSMFKNRQHHAKRAQKAWVGFIPKEGWERMVAPTLLLVWRWLFWNILCDVSRVKFWKVSVIPKEGRALQHAHVRLLVWQQLGSLGIFLHDLAQFNMVVYFPPVPPDGAGAGDPPAGPKHFLFLPDPDPPLQVRELQHC